MILKENEVFGDIEVFKYKDKRMCSVRCKSLQMEVFRIDKNLILNNLSDDVLSEYAEFAEKKCEIIDNFNESFMNSFFGIYVGP